MLLFAERGEMNDLTGRHQVMFVSREFPKSISVTLHIQIEKSGWLCISLILPYSKIKISTKFHGNMRKKYDEIRLPVTNILLCVA